MRYSPDRCIQCRNEPISPDFGLKLAQLFDHQTIKWLEINDTNSPEIPSGAFNGLPYLPELRINNASIQVIQEGAFNGLEFLSKLSLRLNKIRNVAKNYFANLTRLQALDLSFNNIVIINNDSFYYLNKLQILILQNNFIKDLSFVELGMTVVTLDLSFNQLEIIRNQLITNLTNLNTIYLNNNKLKNFEKNFFNLPNLKNIFLNNNNINNLSNLTLPSYVTVFNISKNTISYLSFSKHTVITSLDLTANQIQKSDNFRLKNATIKQLFLDRNYLNNLSFLCEISGVELVSLSENNLNKFNTTIFRNSRLLTRLNLTRNFLTGIDFSELNSVNLQYLNLSFNNFQNLNLSNLVNLRELDVSFNNLTITLDLFRGLRQLIRLNLSNNGITTVPVGCFRDLRLLSGLNLANNRINSLEIGVFVGLSNLWFMNLAGNRLVRLDEGVFHNLRFMRVLDLTKTGIKNSFLENYLSNSVMLREIGLAENNLSCNYLTNLIKKFKIKLISAGDFDTTNVDGVSCKYQQIDTTNLEIENLDLIQDKLSTTNVVLIFVLLVLVAQLLLKYASVKCNNNKLKQFVYKQKSVQELQLVDDY